MQKRSAMTLAGVAILAMGAWTVATAAADSTATEGAAAPMTKISPDDTALDPSVGRPQRGEKGSLHVETRPAGLVVFYDGEEMGKTPFTKEVSSGRGDVSVMMDDYQFSKGRANVFPGKTTNLDYEIKGLFGIVKVKATPATEKSPVSVFIDDRFVGRCFGDWFTIAGKSNELKVGKHFLKLKGAGGLAAQEISLNAGDTTKVEVRLRK